MLSTPYADNTQVTPTSLTEDVDQPVSGNTDQSRTGQTVAHAATASLRDDQSSIAHLLRALHSQVRRRLKAQGYKKPVYHLFMSQWRDCICVLRQSLLNKRAVLTLLGQSSQRLAQNYGLPPLLAQQVRASLQDIQHQSIWVHNRALKPVISSVGFTVKGIKALNNLPPMHYRPLTPISLEPLAARSCLPAEDLKANTQCLCPFDRVTNPPLPAISSVKDWPNQGLPKALYQWLVKADLHSPALQNHLLKSRDPARVIKALTALINQGLNAWNAATRERVYWVVCRLPEQDDPCRFARNLIAPSKHSGNNLFRTIDRFFPNGLEAPDPVSLQLNLTGVKTLKLNW